MGIKDRFSKKEKPKKSTTDVVKEELSKELNEDKENVIKHSKRIKKLWQTKEIVQFKTDAIAVLWKKKGREDEFFENFDKLTKEGYELKMSEGIKALDAGPIDMQIGLYYYFQHKDFVK